MREVSGEQQWHQRGEDDVLRVREVLVSEEVCREMRRRGLRTAGVADQERRQGHVREHHGVKSRTRCPGAGLRL